MVKVNKFGDRVRLLKTIPTPLVDVLKAMPREQSAFRNAKVLELDRQHERCLRNLEKPAFWSRHWMLQKPKWSPKMDNQRAMEIVREQGILKGVCSTCQQGGIELIYEDEHTVLQEHEAFGKHCNGSYNAPETTHRVKMTPRRA